MWKEVERINELELKQGMKLEASWHWEYRKSSWIYFGGLPYKLSEGDVLCIFSQCVPALCIAPRAVSLLTLCR